MNKTKDSHKLENLDEILIFGKDRMNDKLTINVKKDKNEVRTKNK